MRQPKYFLVVTALLVAGCDRPAANSGSAAEQQGSGMATDSQTGGAAKPEIVTGELVASQDPETLRFLLAAPGTYTLDPAMSYDTAGGRYLENMYETLVGYKGNTSELEGVLAENWTLSEDGYSLRFDLRPNVKFHSGNVMTCADAEYTFRRNLVMNHPASSNWFLSQSLLDTSANAKDDPEITWKAITKAVKCDGETLVFTMPKYDPAFVPKLAYIGQAIVDSKHAKSIGEWDGKEASWKQWVGKDTSDGALNKKPSGTGPYQLTARNKDSIEFAAFERYWDGKPKIKKVVFNVEPDKDKRAQALYDDKTDFASIPIDMEVEMKPGIAKARNMPSALIYALGYNQNIKDEALLGSKSLDGNGIPKDFFKDEDVRLGFSYALDADKYIAEQYKGEAAKTNFALPEGFPGYDADVEGFAFDPAKATEHFKKAYGGRLWEVGFYIKQPYSEVLDKPPLYLTMLKEQLAAINPKFKIEIFSVPDKEMYAGRMSGQYPLNEEIWVPDYADADNIVFPYLGSGGYYASTNSISDKFIDTMIGEARSATIALERGAGYRRLAEYSNARAFYLWLPAVKNRHFFRNSVQGYNPENYNVLRNNYVYWKDLSKK